VQSLWGFEVGSEKVEKKTENWALSLRRLIVERKGAVKVGVLPKTVGEQYINKPSPQGGESKQPSNKDIKQ